MAGPSEKTNDFGNNLIKKSAGSCQELSLGVSGDLGGAGVNRALGASVGDSPEASQRLRETPGYSQCSLEARRKRRSGSHQNIEKISLKKNSKAYF